MIIGQSIRVYLPEANPKGIKICDVEQSITKGILIPRNELKEISQFENIGVAGVYFLLSDFDEAFNIQSIYIGETEDLSERLKEHDKIRPDWNRVIVFLSSKYNLNKGHYKFLERICYNEAKKVGRCKIENDNIPSGASLTPMDKDLSYHFFEDLKIIMGILGFPIFEEIVIKSPEELFYLDFKNAKAKGTFTEEGFVVFANSTANVEEQPSAKELSIHGLREKLIDENILLKDGETYKFTKDYLFGSPSTAGAVVRGGNTNGWLVWKDKDGKTIDELKRR
jgi:hypothetical protein